MAVGTVPAGAACVERGDVLMGGADRDGALVEAVAKAVRGAWSSSPSSATWLTFMPIARAAIEAMRVHEESELAQRRDRDG